MVGAALSSGKPRQSTLPLKVHCLAVVLQVEAPQGELGKRATIGRCGGVSVSTYSQTPLQFDQAGDHLLVPFDAMDLQRLTTDNTATSAACLPVTWLVHNLQLHIFGYAFFPEACPVYLGGLAFGICTSSAPITSRSMLADIGQLGVRVLQHGVDAPNVLGSLAVVPGDDGLQDAAPVHRAFLGLGIGLWGMPTLATGFQP